VAGYAVTPGGTSHAFLDNHGDLTDLGNLGGTFTYTTGINNRGEVVGYSATTGDQQTHAFLWRKGTMTDLGTLGGPYSEAFAVNSSGVVIGESTTKSRPFNFDPFIYSKGTMTDLNTLLPPGVGFTNLTVYGINNRGQIVGIGIDSNFHYRALLLTPHHDNHDGASPTHNAATLDIVAALGASQVNSHDTTTASIGHGQVLVVSPPSSSTGAMSSPQETVNFDTPRNDRLPAFAVFHRRAVGATGWEVIDRVFADFDS
jgi:probable HAF family extracellular repeat protein